MKDRKRLCYDEKSLPLSVRNHGSDADRCSPTVHHRSGVGSRGPIAFSDICREQVQSSIASAENNDFISPSGGVAFDVHALFGLVEVLGHAYPPNRAQTTKSALLQINYIDVVNTVLSYSRA